MENRKVLCNVCGRPVTVCNRAEHLGGITINRIDGKEKMQAMRNIKVSKHRYYLNKSKTKAVKAGDPDAANLLVGEGGEIDAEVAEAYGLETEDAVEVAKVTQEADELYGAMVTAGSGRKTQKNFDRMRLQKKVADKLEATKRPDRSGVRSRQAAMLGEGLVNTELAKQDDLKAEKTGGANEPPANQAGLKAQSGTPGQTGGETDKVGLASPIPVNSVTKQIGKQETDKVKTGVQDADIKDPEDKGKSEIKE